MNLLNTKVMLGIAAVALGISIMVSTYVFTGSSQKEETESSIAVSVEAENDVVLLVEESPFMNKCMVTNVTEFAGVYDTPSDTGVILGKMYIGACADVLERGETWTKISSGTVAGYVNNAYLAFDEAAETIANQVCKWVATVNADALNVRSAPDQNAGVFGLLYKGEVYDVLGNENGWVTIQFQENTGYVSTAYLTITQDIKSAISIAEEEAAIRAEQERLAAIAAEEARRKAEEEARIQAQVAGAQFADVLAISPYTMVSQTDAYLIACVVDCESGYQPHEGKIAVANVILNRVSWGGKSVSDVVYARNQFSVVGATLTKKMINGPSADTIQATKEALSGVNIVPEYASFISAGAAQLESYSSYIQIGGHIFYAR